MGFFDDEEYTDAKAREAEGKLHDDYKTLFLDGPIERDNISNLIKKLLLIAQNSHDEDTTDEQITIYINTNGGSVYELLRLYDVCQSIKNPICTVVCGCAFSAGAWIAACCGTKGYRFANKNSVFMIHELSSGMWGKMSELDAEHAESKRLQELLNELLFEHTKFTKAKFKKQRADYYFTPTVAKRLGVIDKVL
jgi:ATP-dependent Clp protease protease subunit